MPTELKKKNKPKPKLQTISSQKSECGMRNATAAIRKKRKDPCQHQSNHCNHDMTKNRLAYYILDSLSHDTKITGTKTKQLTLSMPYTVNERSMVDNMMKFATSKIK